MVFFIDEARSRPPRLLTNVNKKMFFFIEGFPKKIKMSNFNSEELLCPVRFPPRSSVLWRTFNGICGKLLTAPGWV